MFGLLRKRGVKEPEPVQQKEPDYTTQAGRILKHLQKHGKITNIQINSMYILRGAARIKELRDDGYSIRTIQVNQTIWLYLFEDFEGKTV